MNCCIKWVFLVNFIYDARTHIRQTTTNACNFAFLFLNTHLFPSFDSIRPNTFLFFISPENLILFKFMMPFFSLSHYLWLTLIQRKSMCSYRTVLALRNWNCLLFLGVPSHTWRTGCLEKRKWKDVLYEVTKRYGRNKAKHKSLIDVKFVTLDTCFRLEITPVCTLHSILLCYC